MAASAAIAIEKHAQPTQSRVIALSVYPSPMIVTKAQPARISVVLRNVSKSRVTLDAKLGLGGQVQIYALDESGKRIQLSYPVAYVRPPTKRDFVTLAPGKSVSKTIEVRWSMLPESARRTGYSCQFLLTASITNSGSSFGLKAWTGRLWNYFHLFVSSKNASPKPVGKR